MRPVLEQSHLHGPQDGHNSGLKVPLDALLLLGPNGVLLAGREDIDFHVFLI